MYDVAFVDVQLGNDATFQMLDGLPVSFDDDDARGVRGAVKRRQKAPGQGAAEGDEDDQRSPADGLADRWFRFTQIQHFALPVDDEFRCHEDNLNSISVQDVTRRGDEGPIGAAAGDSTGAGG